MLLAGEMGVGIQLVQPFYLLQVLDGKLRRVPALVAAAHWSAQLTGDQRRLRIMLQCNTYRIRQPPIHSLSQRWLADVMGMEGLRGGGVRCLCSGAQGASERIQQEHCSKRWQT
jgi:hypothetical protein